MTEETFVLMRWITDEIAAKQLLLEAGTCRYIDSRRYATPLSLVSFDDTATCRRYFADLIQLLLGLSEDSKAHYMVLDPDPVKYFHYHFGKYPIVTLEKGDTPETYLQLLNEDPGDSRADAVGTNCYEWVILPQSHRWFVHCLRDADNSGGHLWMPSGWIEKSAQLYPWLQYPPELSSISF